MILIVESGSSKAEWILIKEKKIYRRFISEGINPAVHTTGHITNLIRTELPEWIFSENISFIFFYGAGCIGDKNKKMLGILFKEFFGADSKIESDLLAAVKALFQDESGIACILGTGSNSGFYDSENMRITKTVPSLGYILGDEGSGSVLGKMFLSDCLKRLAPDELVYSFTKEYDITYPDILDKIYKQPSPNRFMADFSRFLVKHTEKEYVRNLIKANFRNFFEHCILQYDYKNYPIGFVGSIAFYYKELLTETASEYGIGIYKILQSPTEELIRLHTKYLN